MRPTPDRLKIALAQPLAVPGDIAENLRRMTPLVASAAARGAELVLFSECGLTGYDLKGVAIRAAVSLDDPILMPVAELARQHNIAIVNGLFEKLDGRVYNTSVAWLPDGQRMVQRKREVTPIEKEHGVVAEADAHRIFEFKGFRFAILICSDNDVVGVFAHLARRGCDLVLGPTAGCGSDTKGFHQNDLRDPARLEAYLKASEGVCFANPRRMLESSIAAAWCNQAGYDASTGYFHPGHSAIIDHTGEITALIPGRLIFEHLRPDLALGFVTRKVR